MNYLKQNLEGRYKNDPAKNGLKLYRKEVEKLFYAAYVAYRTYGGQDLHMGNVGYFANNPDVYYFFDM